MADAASSIEPDPPPGTDLAGLLAMITSGESITAASGVRGLSRVPLDEEVAVAVTNACGMSPIISVVAAASLDTKMKATKILTGSCQAPAK